MVECARLEIVLRRNTYGGSNPLLCAKDAQMTSVIWASFDVKRKERTSVGGFAPPLAVARAD